MERIVSLFKRMARLTSLKKTIWLRPDEWTMSSPVSDIENLIGSIRDGRVMITDHAVEEAWNDDLTFDEIIHSVFDGRIIEEYLDDRPYPSYLVSGRSFKGKTIHSVGHTIIRIDTRS